MQQRQISEREEAVKQTLPQQERQRAARQKGNQNFVHWDHEQQQIAFFAWLPKELHDAPGIDWTQLAPNMMRYCIFTIGRSPDAAVLAMAAVSLHRAIDLGSQRTVIKNVWALLRELRSGNHIQSLNDLRHELVWNKWGEHCDQKRRGRARQLVNSYVVLSTGHYPRYLNRLDPSDRLRMQYYALPLPPLDLREKYFPAKQVLAQEKAKRKSTTDILVPLYPVLRQLIRFRKQLAERTLLAFREARQKVEVGEAVLPYHFQQTDTIPEMNRDARSIAEVQIQGRTVTMNWVLWDKSTWVMHHQDRYEKHSVSFARLGKNSYSAEMNSFFVQFDGPASDCLWFGEIIEHRLLKNFEKHDSNPPGYQESWQYARQLGFTNGCNCDLPGLLSPSDRWFAGAAGRGNELIFEPESLYRGILFGATLAMLSLSNGSRMNELLQVSWNKERRITRTETVMVLEDNGQPQLGEDRKPVTRQVKLHFQHLLPKGAKSDEERQLFPLSKEVVRLLGEIKMLLEQTHGTIPIVVPDRSNAKFEHLGPERYLFQWNASADGEAGALGTKDVQVLLRFILHGLDLYTTQGKPIRVSVHILRHVMATHARHHRNVPPEAIAYFFLHHHLKTLTGRDPSLPDISEYYTLRTEEQRFAIISADLDEQEEMDHALLQTAPSPRDLEKMNEDMRIIFDLWHALHPTALGYCGCPGLCPREADRALCLGCSYLVTDPERLGVAFSWRDSYASQAKLLEIQGNFIDARQARIKVQLLDDVINVMRLQLQAEADGSYIPLYKVLPSPHRKREDRHEEED